MSDPSDLTDYVRCTAQLLELPLSDEQVARVALHLQRTQAIAATMREVPLAAHDEIAEIYRPAPFPAEDPRC